MQKTNGDAAGEGEWEDDDDDDEDDEGEDEESKAAVDRVLKNTRRPRLWVMMRAEGLMRGRIGR